MEITVEFQGKKYTANLENWQKMLEWQRDVEKNYGKNMPQELKDFYNWYYNKQDDKNI